MEKTGVQKLAGVLKVLVTIAFICNLVVLPLVPGMVMFKVNVVTAIMQEPFLVFTILPYLAVAWVCIWANQYTAALALFLLCCGTCTAILLWQGRRVLDTVIKGETFTFGNAANMKRAAVCCFVISAAALVRAVWGVCFYRSILPLLSYNALFVPIFLMAGLLCLVMSALFRQAAEMKAENDLTI